MRDTYMYKTKGLVDSSMTYQIKLEIHVKSTNWLWHWLIRRSTICLIMARSINFNRAHSPSLLGICRGFIIFSSERYKWPTVAEADLYYVIYDCMLTNVEIRSILMVPTYSLLGTNLILVLLFHTLAFFSQV